MNKPERQHAHRYWQITGPFPELPEHTVVLSALDWEGRTLVEFTLADLKRLKGLLATDEIKS